MLQKNSIWTKNAGYLRNMEVYVDDIVLKRTFNDFLDDLKEIFKVLMKVNMKLNLKKCTFGVGEGMFLGYMISK